MDLSSESSGYRPPRASFLRSCTVPSFFREWESDHPRSMATALHLGVARRRTDAQNCGVVGTTTADSRNQSYVPAKFPTMLPRAYGTIELFTEFSLSKDTHFSPVELKPFQVSFNFMIFSRQCHPAPRLLSPHCTSPLCKCARHRPIVEFHKEQITRHQNNCGRP